MFGIKRFVGKYVGLASLMVGPTILQANKPDGPAVIVLIFEPCLCTLVIAASVSKILLEIARLAAKQISVR